ncbi:MAG: hypothetical protein JWM28_1791 [Chitinophagaceae bacterium]|nr:hypothetical protein [Chitinophagaceae bacterium]
MQAKKSNQHEGALLIGSLRDSLFLLRKNDPLRMAGATAFFTTFALPPIVFILAILFGLFIGRRNAGRGLLENLSNTLGKDGAAQVREVIRSIRGLSDSWYVLVFGFLFLVFVATTLFSVIKNSLNQIWQISIKERPGILFMLSFRARSFAVILVVGILFLADIFFASLNVLAGKYIDQVWSGSGSYFQSALAQIISIVIIAAWFILLFRFLADGRPSWKAAVAGGLLTGILFMGGRWLLKLLLVNSNIGHLYGTAGSFVLVLLFVFYSSFILYYGACFISVYSTKKNWLIIPGKKAFNYRIEEKIE